jgi:hypothetical protein
MVLEPDYGAGIPGAPIMFSAPMPYHAAPVQVTTTPMTTGFVPSPRMQAPIPARGQVQYVAPMARPSTFEEHAAPPFAMKEEDHSFRQSAGARPKIELTQRLITMVGLGTLILMVAIPFSDACILVYDSHYAMWHGVDLPTVVIIALVTLVFVFFLVSSSLTGFAVGSKEHNFPLLLSIFCIIVALFIFLVSGYMFSHDHEMSFLLIGLLVAAVVIFLASVGVDFRVTGGPATSDVRQQLRSLSTLISTFCILLAVILSIASVQMFYQTSSLTTTLFSDCAGGMASTHLTSRYYYQLLTLRQTPECAKKASVEECAGVSAAAPAEYTSYLKSLEFGLHCTGFCYQNYASSKPEPVADQLAAEDSQAFCQMSVLVSKSLNAKKMSSNSTAISLLDKKSKDNPKPNSNATSPNGTSAGGQTSGAKKAERSMPPALFSTYASKTSCEGALARHLNYKVMGIATTWWWMSIALVSMAIIVSAAEWWHTRKMRS